MSKILSGTYLRRIFTALCLVVFTSGVITYSAASRKQSETTSAGPPFPAFTLTVIESEIDPQGVKTRKGFYIQDVAADGSSVMTRYAANSDRWIRTEQSLTSRTTTTSEGKSHTVDSPLLPLDAKNPRVLYRTEGYLQKHPDVVRTETVLGLTAYRLKHTRPDGSWMEYVYATKTGTVPLISLFHRADGSEQVYEGVHLVFK